MTYVIGSKVLKLKCNECGLTVEENSEFKTSVEVTRSLWAKVKNDGWTSTSTHHYCGNCSKNK